MSIKLHAISKTASQAEYELLQTERNYVRDLEVIIEVFKKPIEQEKVRSPKEQAIGEPGHGVQHIAPMPFARRKCWPGHMLTCRKALMLLRYAARSS
jgi:hypothetical protein